MVKPAAGYQSLACSSPEAVQTTGTVAESIEATLTYYRLQLAHYKHMKSTNMLERFNQELKWRTHVVRIFPNAESCLRLVRALAVQTHESWLEKGANSVGYGWTR